MTRLESGLQAGVRVRVRARVRVRVRVAVRLGFGLESRLQAGIMPPYYIRERLPKRRCTALQGHGGVRLDAVPCGGGGEPGVARQRGADPNT